MNFMKLVKFWEKAKFGEERKKRREESIEISGKKGKNRGGEESVFS